MDRSATTRQSSIRKKGLHARIMRRRAIRRRLVAGGLILALGGAVWAFTYERPLLPHEVRGSAAWGYEHYGDPDTSDYREKNIITIEFLGTTMFVHKKVERHFYRLERIFEARAPEYAATVAAGVVDDWSYQNRVVRGETSAKSNHAFGLAIDVNALANVLGTEGNMPTEVVEQWEREGGDWGGDWSRPDPMHFESHLTPAEIKERYRPDGTPKEWYLEELTG